MVMSLQFVAYTSTQTWLPAMLWAVHGLASEARPRWALLLAAFAALAFLGGHTQGFVFEMQFAVAYGLFAVVAVTPRGLRVRVIALAILGGVLTIALAAPQLLPALELTHRGVRGLGGLSPRDTVFGSLAPAGLAWGALGPLFAPGLGSPDASPSWFVVWPLLGLPLLASGVLVRETRLTWGFFVVSTVLLGLFMTGWWSPVFRLYYTLPMGALFRVPARIIFLYVFAIGVLMGIGTHALAVRVRASGRASAAAVLGGILVALSLADLYLRARMPVAHQTIAPFPPPPPPGVARALEEEGRSFIEYGGGFPPANLTDKVGMMRGVFVLPDYEPSMPWIYEHYFRAPSPPPWHGALSLAQSPLSDATLGRLLDLMSVRRLVSSVPSRDRALFTRFADGAAREIDGMLVVDRPSALPRAYAVRCARQEVSVDGALVAMTSPAFDPRAEAFVSEARDAGAPRSEASCTQNPGDTAAIVAYDLHRVDLDATCGARCLLVLTDLWYPGWRVAVDGAPAAMLRTNVLYRGVWLEPGHHRVTYRYAPNSFRAGLALCAGAVGATLAAGLWERTRSRRRAAAPT
jgi:hypothetical protein